MADQIARCGYMISGEPDPCGMRIEQVSGTWRHEYRVVDRHHDAVPPTWGVYSRIYPELGRLRRFRDRDRALTWSEDHGAGDYEVRSD